MMIIIKRIGLLISLIVLFIFFGHFKIVRAEDGVSFVNIVNPIRISSYNNTPLDSLRSEYEIVNKYNLPATWLLTFDVIVRTDMVSEIKEFKDNQELGLFLEVTPDFAQKSGVTYRNTGFWHHANSVFLSGYPQDDRKKLIDTIFDNFKGSFGYYPKSVGSWWTDAYSLSYMVERYGITANLVCADQYSTDGYQIWGLPWALPYYPSKLHTGFPAQDKESKINVVNIQWAPRDPLNGYFSSLYSTQDYSLAPKPQNLDFFKKLIEVYSLEKPAGDFGQITVGLEGDLNPEGYQGQYNDQIEYVSKIISKDVRVTTMDTFAGWYKEKYSGVSPATSVALEDILGSSFKSFWYSSSNYRLFYTEDLENGEISIKDLRIYGNNYTEPYYSSPNYSFNLQINNPAVIDSLTFPESAWKLPRGSVIETKEKNIIIKGNGIKIPELIKKSNLVSVTQNRQEIIINIIDNEIRGDGEIVKYLSAEAIHYFNQTKAIPMLLLGKGWNYFRKIKYYIPNGELSALFFLSSLPRGKVLVYDLECLTCDYHTQYRHPVFANIRSYVSKHSGKKIVKHALSDSDTRQDTKNFLKRYGIKYIYLVKFENYQEKIPFSPGDLGVRKIFSNANAEIWEIVSKI